MSTRTNIENFIEAYEGTAIGQDVKNMYENETDLEYICDYAGIPYEECEDGDQLEGNGGLKVKATETNPLTAYRATTGSNDRTIVAGQLM